MGLGDWLGNLFGSSDPASAAAAAATTATGGGDWWSPAATSALIQTGAGLISGMTQPDPYVPYSQTEAAFNANMALDREKMAQALEIARMNAASAGAGSGAAVAAARIAQQTAFKQIKEKAAADNLAAEMDYQRTATGARQGAAQLAVQAAQNVGEQGRLGFQNAAQLLSAYKA